MNLFLNYCYIYLLVSPAAFLYILVEYKYIRDYNNIWNEIEFIP